MSQAVLKGSKLKKNSHTIYTAAEFIPALYPTCLIADPRVLSWGTETETDCEFQARACNTLAFNAVARSATHRHGARRPAPWPRARTGARTATLPWRGAPGAGKGVPPPPRQRRRPAGVARRPPEGPSLRRAAHLRTAGGAADTAHGRAGGTDRRATERLQPRRSMASEIADEPPLQKLARRHDHPRVIVGGSNPGSRRARSPRATRGAVGGVRGAGGL